MKFNLTHEKTTFIPVDGQVVQVSTLSEELKNEIETLDRMQQEKIDILFQLEIAELAGIMKTSQVQQMVTTFIKKLKEDQEAKNDQARPAPPEKANEKSSKKK